MDIILDTNALISDLTLASPSFRVLFDGVARLDAKLCVTEISLEEAARRFRADISALTKSAEQLRRLSGRDFDLSAFGDLDVLVAEYKVKVSKLFTVLPTPAVSHSKVVERILAERSPSRGGDRGYRDTLIWETVLERLASQAGNLLLVTADGDFSDKSGRPHIELLSDMDARGIAHDRLTIYKAVALLNKERVEPLLAAVSKYEALLKADTLPNFSLAEWFEDAIAAEEDKLAGRATSYLYDPDLSIDLLELNDIDVTDVRGLDNGDIYLQAEATFYALFRVSQRFGHPHDEWQPYERHVQRDGNYVAYAELVLRSNGEIVSADLYAIDKLA